MLFLVILAVFQELTLTGATLEYSHLLQACNWDIYFTQLSGAPLVTGGIGQFTSLTGVY
jgi:uncharacterized protein YjbI with pentapeptide repeats